MIISDLEILNAFKSISLEEMDSVKLLDRVDTKFTFQRDQLPGFLEELWPCYQVLNVNKSRINRYKTCYFDTSDFRFYLQHHNGKLNRWKIRSRKYIDSDQCYFEIKFKNNKGRTIKDRIRIKEVKETIDDSSKKFLTKKTPFLPGMLQPMLTVLYDRITLVDIDFHERLTLDTRLSFRTADEELSFPRVVIAEIKQEKASQSLFLSLMHQHHIRKQAISKYCLGVAGMFREVKKNNFKIKLRQINKLNHVHL